MEKHSSEVLVSFEKVISEEDWDKIFKETKTLSKCNGQRINDCGSSVASYDKCNNCNIVK